jgi:hypothetical protein
MVVAIEERVLGCGVVGRGSEAGGSADATGGRLAVDGPESAYDGLELLLADLGWGQNRQSHYRRL